MRCLQDAEAHIACHGIGKHHYTQIYNASERSSVIGACESKHCLSCEMCT